MQFWHNGRMPDEHTLTLRQVDQARTDFALIEGHLEFLTDQLARVPTRAYLCRMLLLATAGAHRRVAAAPITTMYRRFGPSLMLADPKFRPSR